MRITYASLKGFKRFNQSRIDEFEAEFVSPVQIITGSNGCGKSSVMRELSPLPSIRTDYEKNGRKELHITHEGHQYKLITDFTNRVSPHSFVMDDVELNNGHTSDIQEELSIKHFGFTPALRNLIYNKVNMCNMTPAQRKELFLHINPMDLSLILETHKLALQKFKDCKANLKMLHTRKGNLEAQMIKPEILAQHETTLENLTNEMMELDKAIYALQQHVINIKDRFREDFEYRDQCNNNGLPLIPKDKILAECKRIIAESAQYKSVPRGAALEPAKEALRLERSQLLALKDSLVSELEKLKVDIDDYNQHLQNANGRSSSEVETELKILDQELSKYQNLPQTPVPPGLLERYDAQLDHIKEILYIFQEAEVKMVDPEELVARYARAEQLKNITALSRQKIDTFNQTIEQHEADLKSLQDKVQIPSTCTSTTCGMKNLFISKQKKLEQQLASDRVELKVMQDEHDKKIAELVELDQFLEPYTAARMLENYQSLLSKLNSGYFRIRDWDTELVHLLAVEPLKILKDLTEYLTGSKLCVERDKLLQQKQVLVTELDVLTKSSKTSTGFLKKKIEEMSKTLQSKLQKLQETDTRLSTIDTTYQLYLRYTDACNQVTEFQRIYDKGERAILVSNAIEYWKQLGKALVEIKKELSAKIMNLKSIVHEQEVLKQTYESETLSLIDAISKDSITYEKIVFALSPNSGIPHGSMVKYLNSMINNANYFLSQLWTFKIALQSVPDDRPLDYKFPIELGNDIAGDINHLSDGQTEAVNLTWVLSILLQMKMLNHIPLFCDELGRAMDPTHRQHLLDFLNKLVDSKLIDQLFLVNHYAALSNGFTNCDVICLNTQNLTELPPEVNRRVRIVNY